MLRRLLVFVALLTCAVVAQEAAPAPVSETAPAPVPEAVAASAVDENASTISVFVKAMSTQSVAEPV